MAFVKEKEWDRKKNFFFSSNHWTSLFFNVLYMCLIRISVVLYIWYIIYKDKYEIFTHITYTEFILYTACADILYI